MRNTVILWLLMLGLAIAQGFQLKEKDFEIQLPAEPKKTDATVWEVDHAGNAYRVSVDPCDTTPEATFAQAKTEFSKSFTFVNAVDGKIDGLPSQRQKYTVQGTAMECLMVVREGKMYMVMAIVGGAQADVDKVFSSLHLL